MTKRREEKALLEFKHVLDDVVQLLRKSTEADTVYMYWVNRSREQFVLESSSTILPNVMFSDRVEFGELYLNSYKEIEQVMQLKVGDDVDGQLLKHYYDFVPVRFLTLIPFINNGETVAITVVETEYQLNVLDYEEVLSAYRNALLNVLNTYLELTDLYEQQQEWVDYEHSINSLSAKMHKVDILDQLVQEMDKLLPTGGITVVARGMNRWVSVLSSVKAPDSPSLGLMVEEKSMAYDALQKGEAQFSIHFNQNPKRISSSENLTEGATLAIPLKINDRRHAVILAYDKNPLVFKESSKHKLNNLVRIAALAIQVNLGKVPIDEDIFTSEYGSFIPDLWERSLKTQIIRSETASNITWFGFITIDNIAELRSSVRLESLKHLQKTMVNLLSPSGMGFNGLIGFNSDYIYSYLLVGERNKEFEEWKNKVLKTFEKPIELVNGQSISVDIRIGSVHVDSARIEVHELISQAKQALSLAVKESVKTAGNY
ncbi:MAG: GAF domain-containing protein [Balneolaceae bacterium]|nr:MAG: GAF domain-containing protein [Balneolaceae bacterium]